MWALFYHFSLFLSLVCFLPEFFALLPPLHLPHPSGVPLALRHQPGLSSHSEHPFTSSSHLPDFHPSLLSYFSVLLSFLFLPPPIYQISPVVSNLILNLAFVIFKTSSFFPRPTDLSLPFFPISHFPSSSHLQNQNTAIFSSCRDISPFLDNLMVSTMNTIYCLNAIHLG